MANRSRDRSLPAWAETLATSSSCQERSPLVTATRELVGGRNRIHCLLNWLMGL